MITLIAAALVAAQPAAPAPAPANSADHSSHQTAMGQAEQHKGMDCCKDCCKDMFARDPLEHVQAKCAGMEQDFQSWKMQAFAAFAQYRLKISGTTSPRQRRRFCNEPDCSATLNKSKGSMAINKSPAAGFQLACHIWTLRCQRQPHASSCAILLEIDNFAKVSRS